MASGASQSTPGSLQGEAGSGQHRDPRDPPIIPPRPPLTSRHGLHVPGELAADVVVVGADVMEAPVGELVGAVKLEEMEPVSEPPRQGSPGKQEEFTPFLHGHPRPNLAVLSARTTSPPGAAGSLLHGTTQHPAGTGSCPTGSYLSQLQEHEHVPIDVHHHLRCLHQASDGVLLCGGHMGGVTGQLGWGDSGNTGLPPSLGTGRDAVPL